MISKFSLYGTQMTLIMRIFTDPWASALSVLFMIFFFLTDNTWKIFCYWILFALIHINYSANASGVKCPLKLLFYSSTRLFTISNIYYFRLRFYAHEEWHLHIPFLFFSIFLILIWSPH